MGIEEKEVEQVNKETDDKLIIKEDALEVFNDLAGETPPAVQEAASEDEAKEVEEKEPSKKKEEKEEKKEAAPEKKEEEKPPAEEDKEVKPPEFKTLREAVQFEIEASIAAKEGVKKDDETGEKKKVVDKKAATEIDWESPENPYRQRQSATNAWGRELAANNAALQGEIKRLSENFNVVVDTLKGQGTPLEGLKPSQEPMQQVAPQVQVPHANVSPQLMAHVDAAYDMFDRDDPGIVTRATQWLNTPGALSQEQFIKLHTSNSPAITLVQMYKEVQTTKSVGEKKESAENGNGKGESTIDIDAIVDATLKRLGKTGDEKPGLPLGLTGMQGETRTSKKGKTGPIEEKPAEPFNDFAG